VSEESPSAAAGIDDIRTRDDLVEYLRILAGRVRRNEIVVENEQVADYIEASSAWLNDMDGYFSNRGQTAPQSPSWSIIAMIMAAGIVYE
jgi:hypothetical protein